MKVREKLMHNLIRAKCTVCVCAREKIAQFCLFSYNIVDIYRSEWNALIFGVCFGFSIKYSDNCNLIHKER